MVVKEKKRSHVAIVCESKITKHMKFWCSMSIFCFREALAYLGLQLRATFQKEIDKQEAEIKIKKFERRISEKAFMKCGSQHKKARSRKLFHLRVERWGTFKIKYFKPKQSSVLVSKAKNWTESHRKDQNLYSRNAEVVQRVFFLPTKQKPRGCCPWWWY